MYQLSFFTQLKSAARLQTDSQFAVLDSLNGDEEFPEEELGTELFPRFDDTSGDWPHMLISGLNCCSIILFCCII